MNIIKTDPLSVEDKFLLMREDAKFEVGCDSDAETTAIQCANGIKGITAPPKVPKTFLASKCIFNCAYCRCRCSREDRREYCNSPRELADMSLLEVKRGGHGIFISSAIYKNADYTQELIAESVRILREEHHYNGYLHAKVMPGADPLLVERTGKYANRLSINIEVAKSSGYSRIAKQKNKRNILLPMRNIAEQIAAAKYEKRHFATSQTTQLMAGSTDEDDRTIITLSKALYDKYSLSRVYYTPFQYRQPAKGYESENLPPVQTPYWRMARLYQADRLLQVYGFSPDDLTPNEEPYLQKDIDPKAAWALRHLDMYPIEVNTADYETLIRIPGIGVTYAKRILKARRHCTLTHDTLRKLRISLKRSIYFITCNGEYKGGNVLSTTNVREALTYEPKQLSIFHSLTADEKP